MDAEAAWDFVQEYIHLCEIAKPVGSLSANVYYFKNIIKQFYAMQQCQRILK